MGRVKCDDLLGQYVFPCQFLIVVVFCCLIWSISHLTLSSSFSQTQQPFNMLPRSTPTSATGSCQVWRPWNKVSLSLQSVNICLFFLFGPFHISPVLLPPPKNTTAFYNAKAFNADISKWVVSSVTNMYCSTSFLANCWYFWSLLFYLVDFTSYTVFFLLPNTTAFMSASSFNVDISQWVVSRVTRMDNSTSCLANCW